MDTWDCDEESALTYLELREEGYSSYQAAVMAGLRDTDEVSE